MVSLVLGPIPSAARAGVKTEEKTLVHFGGFLGGFMSKFGGKGAKEAVAQTSWSSATAS